MRPDFSLLVQRFHPDLPMFPWFSLTNFCRDTSSNTLTLRQPMLEFFVTDVLTLAATEVLLYWSNF